MVLGASGRHGGFFKSWVGCLVQVGFKNKCMFTSML
jgi:hypothetical protein